MDNWIVTRSSADTDQVLAIETHVSLAKRKTLDTAPEFFRVVSVLFYCLYTPTEY